jgi:hypothetical protein
VKIELQVVIAKRRICHGIMKLRLFELWFGPDRALFLLLGANANEQEKGSE